jgi:hypothetical protein
VLVLLAASAVLAAAYLRRPGDRMTSAETKIGAAP